MPASHGSPATKCISMPLIRGEPSARRVARNLCACASKAARTRAANSGSSDSTSAKEAMPACCTRRPTDRGRQPAGGRGLPGEGLADHHPLDLVGALEDLHDLRLAHVALDRELAGVAGAAEHLDGVGGHLHGGVGGHQLGDAGLPRVRLAGVLAAGGDQVGGPRGLDGGGHVGEQEGHALVLDDRPAERLPLPGVPDGDVERGLREPDRDGADAQAAGVERGQGDRQAAAALADEPVGGRPGRRPGGSPRSSSRSGPSSPRAGRR